ncbi:MAG TPA: hypothetical protein VFM54_01530 [Micromonosporaceae bacterium]|nr:hypothetical protein [Micromonosporaceae bacterium]
MVADVPGVHVAPQVGDGLVFDPRQYHSVDPATGGRRVAVAFFLALTSAGHLAVWS